ncbi:MAG: hypothetical protein QOF70_5387, partial [Acetobacteraceae bacterium]|nr:hypothetical protein [Acetobacteraceae bacterium]
RREPCPWKQENHKFCDLWRPKMHVVPLFFGSAGALWPPGQLWISPIDPFQHIGHLSRRDRHRAIRRRRPDKPPAVQTLGVKRQSDPVMPQNLGQIATPNDIQHTDRNLLSSNINGIRFTVSAYASANEPGAGARRFCTSRFVRAYLARSRRGCVTPLHVRQCRLGRHRLGLTR